MQYTVIRKNFSFVESGQSVEKSKPALSAKPKSVTKNGGDAQRRANASQNLLYKIHRQGPLALDRNLSARCAAKPVFN